MKEVLDENPNPIRFEGGPHGLAGARPSMTKEKDRQLLILSLERLNELSLEHLGTRETLIRLHSEEQALALRVSTLEAVIEREKLLEKLRGEYDASRSCIIGGPGGGGPDPAA